MAIDPRTDPNATLVTTPLPSQLAREKAARAAAADGTDAERVANAPPITALTKKWRIDRKSVV